MSRLRGRHDGRRRPLQWFAVFSAAAAMVLLYSYAPPTSHYNIEYDCRN